MGRKQTLKRNYDSKGNLISKECTYCHEIKPASEFNKDKSKIDGLRLKCKECLKKYRRDNAESIKEYQKQYQRDNAERIRERDKQYRKNNAERIREHKKQYRKDNAEDIKEYCKEYNTKKVQKALQQIKTEVETNPEKYNYNPDEDIYGIIYLVHNIKSNKYYVGQTTRVFNIRYKSGWLYEHSKKESVKEDLDLYGEESFEYTKLFKVAHSQHELDKLEAYYIDYYDSYENGYNETRGNIFTNRGEEE